MAQKLRLNLQDLIFYGCVGPGRYAPRPRCGAKLSRSVRWFGLPTARRPRCGARLVGSARGKGSDVSIGNLPLLSQRWLGRGGSGRLQHLNPAVSFVNFIASGKAYPSGDALATGAWISANCGRGLRWRAVPDHFRATEVKIALGGRKRTRGSMESPQSSRNADQRTGSPLGVWEALTSCWISRNATFLLFEWGTFFSLEGAVVVGRLGQRI